MQREVTLPLPTCTPEAVYAARRRSHLSKIAKRTFVNTFNCTHDSVVHRWATSARNNAAGCLRDKGSTSELAFILQLMAEGRVEQALSAAMTGHKMHLPASLDSLVGFAANPIPLGAIVSRMRLHDLLAKVRATNERNFPHFLKTRHQRQVVNHDHRVVCAERWLHAHRRHLLVPSLCFVQLPGARIRFPAYPRYHQRDTCLACTAADRS